MDDVSILNELIDGPANQAADTYDEWRERIGERAADLRTVVVERTGERVSVGEVIEALDKEIVDGFGTILLIINCLRMAHEADIAANVIDEHGTEQQAQFIEELFDLGAEMLQRLAVVKANDAGGAE